MIEVESIAFIPDCEDAMTAGIKRTVGIFRLIEEIVDEINSQVSSDYRVRLVHEDGSDFVEVISMKSED